MSSKLGTGKAVVVSGVIPSPEYRKLDATTNIGLVGGSVLMSKAGDTAALDEVCHYDVDAMVPGHEHG